MTLNVIPPETTCTQNNKEQKVDKHDKKNKSLIDDKKIETWLTSACQTLYLTFASTSSTLLLPFFLQWSNKRSYFYHMAFRFAILTNHVMGAVPDKHFVNLVELQPFAIEIGFSHLHPTDIVRSQRLSNAHKLKQSIDLQWVRCDLNSVLY